MGEFDQYVVSTLPSMKLDDFSTLYDDKPSSRKFNRTISTPVDSDMYAAVQDLIANRDLPFAGNMAAFGRHVFAAGIDSLQLFLDKDVRTLWSALQSSQRRLTAERYVVTAEEQVKEAAELLESWTDVREWDAVYADLSFAAQAITDLPIPAWRRRVANEWLSNREIKRLLATWQELMPEDSPETWRKVINVWNMFRRIAEGE